MWVTVIVAISFVIGVVLGIPALLGNGMQETWGIGWGGREIGISVGALIALLARSAAAYLAVLVAGLFRELSDLIEAPANPESTFASWAGIPVFLLIGAIAAWASYKGHRETAVPRSA